MSIASRVITLMSSITAFQVRALPPLERLHLAHECRRLQLAAEPPVLPPRVPLDLPRRPTSGVLAELHDGDRSL
jgi:hypothetical protein